MQQVDCVKFINYLILLTAVATLNVSASESTELRQWTAASGHQLKAVALRVTAGKVHFKRENGTSIQVPLAKLSKSDQEYLVEHFELAGKKETAPQAAEGKPADDLPYPLGKSTEEIACEGGFSYFLYLPKSLKKGKTYPVVYLMNPGGGGAGTANRYIPGAERNGWIIATSKQSKNGENKSQPAVLAMMSHVEKTLPIDKKRIYVSGFSGGSRMAFWATQKKKGIAGIIACGAGGNIGSRKQVAYGLCGSNCFNRTDMANAFKKISHKGAILRYFPGKHHWANAELCEDAITHLNGVFLSKNRSKYPGDYTEYSRQLGMLISDSEQSKPLRAFMWADFAKDYEFDSPQASKAYTSLSGDPVNQLYVEGLKKIRGFAEKTFGKISNSQWQADPKVAAKCKREAQKYVGTPWQEVLNKMSEDAQKF